MKTWHKTIIFLLIALFTLSSYTFLHEGGHALASMLQGGRMTAFSINFFTLNAYVGLDDQLSGLGRAAMNISGMALPVVLWFLFMALAPRRASPVVELLKLMSALIVLSTLLVWIAIPFFYLAGNPPPGDDVTQFLQNSGMPPLLLAGLALLVYAGGWLVYARRSVGLRSAFLLLRDPSPWERGTVQTPLLAMAAGLMLVWGSTLGLNLFLPGEAAPSERLTKPPADYALVNKVDLNQGDLQDVELARFTLTQPGGPGIFLEVRNINTSYIDVRLLGPNGYDQVVLHGEGYFSALDTPYMAPDTALPPGEYRLLLNSRQSPGTLAVYLQRIH